MTHHAVRTALCRGCLAWIAAGLGAGCAIHSSPQIAVVSASITETTEEAHVVSVALWMTNPGARPLELREFEYRVRMDGPGGPVVYTGRRVAQATLSPHETAREMRLTIPAVIRREAHPDVTGRTLAVEGALEFVPPGQLTEMLLDLGLPRPKASFADRVEVRP